MAESLVQSSACIHTADGRRLGGVSARDYSEGYLTKVMGVAHG